MDLASRLEAEVVGLFVEDLNLLRTAGLPFARRIGLQTGMLHTIDVPSVERELKAAAGRVHRILASAAQNRRVPFSFRVVRGHFVREVARASVEADLTILEGGGGRELPRFLRASATRAFVEQARAPVLLLRAEIWLHRSVLVIFDPDSGARPALALAAHFAARGGSGRLEIGLPPTAAARAEEVENEVRALKGCRELELGVSLCPRLTVEEVGALARRTDAGLVVVHAGSTLLEGSDASRLADALRRPVLVVR